MNVGATNPSKVFFSSLKIRCEGESLELLLPNHHCSLLGFNMIVVHENYKSGYALIFPTRYYIIKFNAWFITIHLSNYDHPLWSKLPRSVIHNTHIFGQHSSTDCIPAKIDSRVSQDTRVMPFSQTQISTFFFFSKKFSFYAWK